MKKKNDEKDSEQKISAKKDDTQVVALRPTSSSFTRVSGSRLPIGQAIGDYNNLSASLNKSPRTYPSQESIMNLLGSLGNKLTLNLFNSSTTVNYESQGQELQTFSTLSNNESSIIKEPESENLETQSPEAQTFESRSNNELPILAEDSSESINERQISPKNPISVSQSENNSDSPTAEIAEEKLVEVSEKSLEENSSDHVSEQQIVPISLISTPQYFLIDDVSIKDNVNFGKELGKLIEGWSGFLDGIEPEEAEKLIQNIDSLSLDSEKDNPSKMRNI